MTWAKGRGQSGSQLPGRPPQLNPWTSQQSVNDQPWTFFFTSGIGFRVLSLVQQAPNKDKGRGQGTPFALTPDGIFHSDRRPGPALQQEPRAEARTSGRGRNATMSSPCLLSPSTATPQDNNRSIIDTFPPETGWEDTGLLETTR